MLQLQPNVRVVGLKAETLVALIIADQVFATNGQPTLVKSIVDGNHGFGNTSHYSGTAFDIAVDLAVADVIVAMLNAQLGVEYYVMLNSDHGHIHVAYEPQRQAQVALKELAKAGKK